VKLRPAEVVLARVVDFPGESVALPWLGTLSTINSNFRHNSLRSGRSL